MLDTTPKTYAYYRGSSRFTFDGHVYRYNKATKTIERILGIRFADKGYVHLVDTDPVPDAVIEYEAGLHATRGEIGPAEVPDERLFYPVELTAYDRDGRCVAFRFVEDPRELSYDAMIRKIHEELKGTFCAVRVVIDVAPTHVERPTSY